MPDMETPEADALEQLDPVVEDPDPEVGIEVPEADAVEQAQLANPVAQRLVRPLRDDVPEADAWEQSVDVVTGDDDYDR